MSITNKELPGVNILQPLGPSAGLAAAHTAGTIHRDVYSSVTHHPGRSKSSQPPGHNCQALLPLDHLQLLQLHQGVPLHELEGSLQSLRDQCKVEH